MVHLHHQTREMEIRMDDEFVHEECSHIFSESGDIVEPIHSQVEFLYERRLSYPSTFGSAALSRQAMMFLWMMIDRAMTI